MAASNGNGSFSIRLLFWILGLVGVVLLSGGGFIVSTVVTRMHIIEQQCHDNTLMLASMKTRVQQLDDAVLIVRDALLHQSLEQEFGRQKRAE